MLGRIIVFVFLSACLISCNPGVKGKNGITYKSAVQYNDYIINRQSILSRDVRDFGNIGNSHLDSADTKLKNLIKAVILITDEVKGMPAYRGDSSFRDAAVRYFSFFKKVFEQDYSEYLRLRKKTLALDSANVEELNKTSDEISGIISRVTKEEEGFDKDFLNAQQRYAEKNNMKLTENKISVN